MSKTIVQITWIYENIRETSKFRYGMAFEYYESLAGTGVEVFAEKHNIPEYLVNVEILIKYIRN